METSYLAVTSEAITAERCLAAQVAELHAALLCEVRELNTCFEENKAGLGGHSASIGSLLESLEVGQEENRAVKKLVRRLRLDADIRQAHINGEFPSTGIAVADESQQYLAGVMGRMYSSGYRKMQTPTRNGTLTDEAFVPDLTHVPTKYNPDRKSFGQIAADLQEKFGIHFAGVPFVEGYADFSGIALAQVDMADVVLMHVLDEGNTGFPADSTDIPFSDIFKNREQNLLNADQIAARNQIPIPGLRTGYTADELTTWRRTNRFTWDESYLNGYLLVPSEIHNNIPHTGLVGVGGHGDVTEQKLIVKLKKKAESV